MDHGRREMLSRKDSFAINRLVENKTLHSVDHLYVLSLYVLSLARCKLDCAKRARRQIASIHRVADRDCLKSSPGTTIAAYSPGYDKIPDRSVRRRMGLLGVPPAHSEGGWSAQDPQSTYRTRRDLLCPEERLPVEAFASRLPAMEDRLPLFQSVAVERYLGANTFRYAGASANPVG
jgi:hypothetical protein